MIKRNACLNACFLQHTKKFEYVVFEQKDSLIKYNYCVMQTYFHIDVAFVIILSVVRTMQAFMARKLPEHYNETYYIFLGMFIIANLLMLSIPLEASLNTDGRKNFVNSVVIIPQIWH